TPTDRGEPAVTAGVVEQLPDAAEPTDNVHRAIRLLEKHQIEYDTVPNTVDEAILISPPSSAAFDVQSVIHLLDRAEIPWESAPNDSDGIIVRNPRPDAVTPPSVRTVGH